MNAFLQGCVAISTNYIHCIELKDLSDWIWITDFVFQTLLKLHFDIKLQQNCSAFFCKPMQKKYIELRIVFNNT